jgi:hypothetical protein
MRRALWLAAERTLCVLHAKCQWLLQRESIRFSRTFERDATKRVKKTTSKNPLSVMLYVILAIGILCVAITVILVAGRRAIPWRSWPEVLLRPPFDKENSKSNLYSGRVLSVVPFGDTVECSTRSPVLLCEDGKLLGPAHSLHQDIRNLGQGRYSHWGESILFSTSDNSDPNENGRKYSLRFPPSLPIKVRLPM